MSSISPLAAQRVGAACAERGMAFLDAPVSGGEPKAIDATLAIMVGGEASVYAQVLPLLQCLGSSVTHVGPVGAGNVTKLANQIMVACNIAAMGEALVLAARAGLDPDVVFRAVQGGLAGSAVLNAKAHMVIARASSPVPHPAARKGLAECLARGRIAADTAPDHQPGTADAHRPIARRQGRSLLRGTGHLRGKTGRY